MKSNKKAKKLEKNALMLYFIDNLMELVCEAQEVRYILMVCYNSYVKPFNNLKGDY